MAVFGADLEARIVKQAQSWKSQKFIEKTNVIEYSISEGWIRVAAGRSLDRYGQPMTIKLKGKVEPYFERPAQDDEGVASEG